MSQKRGAAVPGGLPRDPAALRPGPIAHHCPRLSRDGPVARPASLRPFWLAATHNRNCGSAPAGKARPAWGRTPSPGRLPGHVLAPPGGRLCPGYRAAQRPRLDAGRAAHRQFVSGPGRPARESRHGRSHPGARGQPSRLSHAFAFCAAEANAGPAPEHQAPPCGRAGRGLRPRGRDASPLVAAVLVPGGQDAAVHGARRRRRGSRPCRFNMGAKFVAVTAAGAGGPIWSSADCPSGSGSHVVVLTAGRPGVLQVSWDRRTSSAGCRAIRRPVRPGEYKVTAVSGRLRSSTVNIVLGARGASGP